MKRIDDLKDKVLIKNLRKDFRRDGYILFRGFLNESEIETVQKKMKKFISTKVGDLPRGDVYYEDINDKNSLKQLQRLFLHDPYFANMIFGSRFEKLASILLEDEVHGKNIQYFNKPPKIGKPTPAHQDGYYFMLSPSEAVTMWMALEPVDEENGCVRYIKGSHLDGMRAHGKTDTLGFSQGILDFGEHSTDKNEVFYPTEPGDLLVHHSLTIHRADGNSSDNRTRQAMGFIYYADKAKEDFEAQKAYQRKLAEDLINENKV